MIVVGAGGARTRTSQIAELRPHRLQTPGRQSKCCRQALRPGFGGHYRLDKHPRGAVGVGGIVKIQGVGSKSAVGPDRCRDRSRGAVGQRAAAGGHHDPVVRLIRVEGPRGAVGAGVVDGVGLIGFRAAGDVIASQQQGWTRITRCAYGRTLWSFQRGVINRGLRSRRRSHRQCDGGAVNKRARSSCHRDRGSPESRRGGSSERKG